MVSLPTLGWIGSIGPFFFIVIMPVSGFGSPSIEKELAYILTLSEAEKRMIATNEPYSYENYITFALITSGVSASEMTQLKQTVAQVGRDISAAIQAEKVPPPKSRLAEFILDWLHTHFFRTYKSNQTRIDAMLRNHDFNCVSSSILYAAICRKFGINITGIVVKDHVFSQLKLPNQKIDIETTIQYGFDPSSRKDILDQFGRLTGFIYVPQRDYQARTEIGDRQMVALICSNRYKTLSDQKKHAEAAKVLYLSWRLAADLPRTVNTWESGLANYIISLDHAKRYQDALYVSEKSQQLFPQMKQPAELQYNVYVNWSYHLLKSKQFKKGIQVVEKGIQLYPRDRRLQQNLRAAYIDQIQTAIKKHQFDLASRSIEVAKEMLPKEDVFDKLSVNVVIESARNLSFEKSAQIFQQALKTKPNDKVLLEALAFAYIDPAQKLAKQRKFLPAIDILDQGVKEMPNPNQILDAKASIYNNWSLELAKLKQFEEAVQILERGLKIKPSGKTLINNWDATMLEWADFALKKGEVAQGRQVMIQGISKSRNNRRKFETIAEGYYNNQAVKLLNQGKVKEGIRQLEDGLKLVPKSRVLRKNLNLARQQLK